MVFCKFMHTSQDREGKLEFYCRHFDRRIDLNLLSGANPVLPMQAVRV